MHRPTKQAPGSILQLFDWNFTLLFQAKIFFITLFVFFIFTEPIATNI